MWAAACARRLEVPLVLLHAMPPPAPALGRRPETLADAQRREAESFLQRLRTRVRASSADISVQSGPAAEHLVAEAEDGMIVVATRGQGAIRATLLGSVSGELATHAPAPVAVVPPEVDQGGASLDGRSLVCGVEDDADAPAARFAARLAAAFDLTLTLTHVIPPVIEPWEEHHADVPGRSVVARPGDEQAAYSLLETAAAEVAVDAPEGARLRVVEGSAGSALARLAVEEDAALVVVGKPRQGRLGAFAGSTSRHLMRRGTRPVVVCPRAEVPAGLQRRTGQASGGADGDDA